MGKLEDVMKKAKESLASVKKSAQPSGDPPPGGGDTPPDEPGSVSGGFDTGISVGLEKQDKLRGQYVEIIKRRARDDEKERQAIQKFNDDVLLASVACEMPVREVIKRVPQFQEFLARDMSKSHSELAKALAASRTDYGAEWIPTVFSPQLIDLIRNRGLAGLFRKFDMVADEQKFPQLLQDMVSHHVPEQGGGGADVNVPISDLKTGDVVFNSREISAAASFTRNFQIGSIVPALPTVRENLVIAMNYGAERAIANGSRATVHPDADVEAATYPAEKAWDGLRADCMGQDFATTTLTVDLSGANMTVDNLLKMQRLMGKFGGNPADLAWLTSAQGKTRVYALKDANGNQVLLTRDKMGDKALLETGAQGELLGSGLYVFDAIKTTLNNLGVVPSTPGTKTELILVNKKAFWLGDRQQLEVDTDKVLLPRRTLLVGTMYMDFRETAVKETSNDNPVVIGLNMDVAA